MPKKLFHFIITAILVFTIIEGCSYLFCKYLQSKGAIYQANLANDILLYLNRRDPTLGWPEPISYSESNDEIDAIGSRITPAFPDPHEFPSCISLYGDSFTWSSEVDHEHAWGNLLSKMVNCRVSNFGMGGYGTDQAYLRFKSNTKDTARIVILAHLSENILRNTNQFRGFLSPSSMYGYKPRFILDPENKLQLIPLPNFSSQEEYESLMSRSNNLLSYDFFKPNGPSGSQYMEFPFLMTAIQSVKYFRIEARIKGELSYGSFYNSDHPAKGLQVSTEIIKHFYGDALASEKFPIILIFPTLKDLNYFHKKKVWAYENLVNELKKNGIEVLDVGKSLIEFLGSRDPKEIFSTHTPHPNNEGNQLIAKIVYDYLAENNLLK